MNKAVYAGSFDPITRGHMDIIRRGLAIFDHISVAVAQNVDKRALFELEERVSFVEEAFAEEERVSVVTFNGLLVAYALETGASALLRGLRAVSDFEFEFQMASMNRHLSPSLETVFLMAGEEHIYVSSSLVKEVASLGGDVSAQVPAHVNAALLKKFGGGS